MEHCSPSESHEHATLRSEAFAAGFDVEMVRDLLWLTNGHDQLVSFPLFCQNLSRVLVTATSQWQVPITAFHLSQDIHRFLEWVVIEAPKLSSKFGEYFHLQPKHEYDNPVVGRGSTRHPLYAALCNSHASEVLQERFRLLQAHLLFAHSTGLHARKNRAEYENYDGEQPWKGLPNSPAIAALAARQLSENKFSDVLLELSVELSPKEFAEKLNSLPFVRNSDFLKHLMGLRSFVQKAAGLRDWVWRLPNGGRGGGGAWNPGHVDISKKIYQGVLEMADADDVDGNWGQLDQIIFIAPSFEEQKELLESDLHPEEFEEENLLLSTVDTEENFLGGVASNSVAQMRHVMMANQLLPWDYQQLTISEVLHTLVACREWFNATIIKSATAVIKNHDIEKLETVCLLHTMLFTGRSLAAARELVVLPPGKANEDASLALIKVSNKSMEWRVRAIRPNYKLNLVVPDGSERTKADYFALPDVVLTSIYVNAVIKHARIKTGDDGRTRVFASRESTLRGRLKQLLAELDPTGRLTESKLSKFLFFELLAQSGGDVCAASLVIGEEHRLAHVRLFYSMLTVDYLRQLYLNAVIKIESRLYAAIEKKKELPPTTLTPFPNLHVGSRLCPTLEAVKIAIAKLYEDIEKSNYAQDIVKTHNLNTLLTLWHFAFATACRAIDTPYLSLPEIDAGTGIASLADKDDGTGYKARLIWMPPSVMRRMVQHEYYRDELLAQLPDGVANDLPIFFLEKSRSGQLKPLRARPATLEPIMQPYLPYPANFHRRFMRSELLSRGCPVEVVDAYMGHWSMGEEPWAKFSSFNFEEYRHQLAKHLVPLMREIGLAG